MDDAQQNKGSIKNLGMLDLTGMKSPADLEGIHSLENIGGILVPESLSKALLKVPQKNIGGIIPIPEGNNVKVLSGQLKMSGEAFANLGEDGDVYVIAGQVLLTTPVEHIKNREFIVFGQILAPRGSETALVSSVSRLNGQLLYYGSNPRIFVGKDSFSKAFFQLLDDPITLVLIGKFFIEDDVPLDLLKEKVSEVILAGELTATAEIVPLLQVLTVEKAGNIAVQQNDE